MTSRWGPVQGGSVATWPGSDTATFTRERTLAIRALMNKTMEKAREKLPARVYSKELIETIFRQPYTKGQFLVEVGIAQRKTAAEYLKALEKAGIMKSMKIGKQTLYLNKGLYDLLSH
jgi:Fic family protein